MLLYDNLTDLRYMAKYYITMLLYIISCTDGVREYTIVTAAAARRTNNNFLSFKCIRNLPQAARSLRALVDCDADTQRWPLQPSCKVFHNWHGSLLYYFVPFTRNLTWEILCLYLSFSCQCTYLFWNLSMCVCLTL